MRKCDVQYNRHSVMERLYEFDPVVSIVKDSTTSPAGDFQLFHRPANTMGDPSLSRMYHGSFTVPLMIPPVESRTWYTQRRYRTDCFNAGFSDTVTDLALMILLPIDLSFAHDGINPHRR